MGEGDKPQGNGAAPPLLQDLRSLRARSREIREDAAALAAEIGSTTTHVERYLSDQLEHRPYVTLGVAAGVGFLLGGGLRSRLTTMVLGGATRVVAALAVREISDRFLQPESTMAQNKSA